MSTDLQVAPGEATQNPTPETQAPEVVTPEVEANAEQEGDKGNEPEDADKALKRMQRRIDKRTADVYRERARVEQLTAELERVSQAGGEQKPQEQDDPRVLARQIAREDREREKIDKIIDTGRSKHKDFDGLTRAVADEIGTEYWGTFKQVLLEVTDRPEDLVAYLGKNPELAEELVGLSNTKLTLKLDRIERELADKSKPKPGSAPKPIEPVRATSSDPGLHTGLSTEEWMKRREAEIREKRGR